MTTTAMTTTLSKEIVEALNRKVLAFQLEFGPFVRATVTNLMEKDRHLFYAYCDHQWEKQHSLTSGPDMYKCHHCKFVGVSDDM